MRRHDREALHSTTQAAMLQDSDGNRTGWWCRKGEGATYWARAHHVPADARPGAHPRALRGTAAHWRPALRGAEARGAAAALRPAPRDGRGAEELGGAEGAFPARGGEAARGSRRGPPHRVRRLRGRDPDRQLRRRV